MISRKKLDELALKVARNRYVKVHGGTGEGINFGNYAEFAHTLLVAVQGELEVVGYQHDSGIISWNDADYNAGARHALTTLPLVEE